MAGCGSDPCVSGSGPLVSQTIDLSTLTGFDFHTERTDGVPGHVNHFNARNDLSIEFDFGEIDIFYEVVVVAMIQRVGGFAESYFSFVRIESRFAKQRVVTAMIVMQMGVDNDIDILGLQTHLSQTLQDTFGLQSGLFAEASGRHQLVLIKPGIDKDVSVFSLQ